MNALKLCILNPMYSINDNYSRLRLSPIIGNIQGDNDIICYALSMFTVAAAILWVFFVQCKHDQIIRVL